MPPFQLALYFPGTFAAAAVLWRMIFLTPSITFTQGAWISAVLAVATNGTLTITISKNAVALATLTWTNGATVPTISVIATTTFVASDKLEIVRTAGTDTAAARLSITFLGARA